MGGIGINLAIGDAVATANLIGLDLLRAQADDRRFERILNPAIPARVERRRRLPTVLTQRVQALAQNRVIALTTGDPDRPIRPPAPVRALLRSPLTRLIPRVFVYGIRPERLAS